MRFPILLALCAASLSGPASAKASDSGCPGFRTDPTSPTDVDRFYGTRVVEIVRAAQKQDRAGLAKLISPDFRFHIWGRDTIAGFQAKGADAAIEMAGNLKATSYQFVAVISGPDETIAPPERCNWSTKLLWRRPDDTSGLSIIFDFEEGLLVRASGSLVVIEEGDIR